MPLSCCLGVFRAYVALDEEAFLDGRLKTCPTKGASFVSA
jgi:hypothetical protein